MITNPVYRREMMVSSRSIRMPLIIAGFNLILAAFALFSMLATVSAARQSAQINYATFLVIFRYVATIEFALMLFTMPALTAGSISSEREHRTLDLMLITKLTPFRIVMGKLMTAISTMFLIVVSSLPILALVFAYGGVTVKDLLLLFVSFFTVAFFTAAIGIWASSISERTTVATAVTYAMILIFVGGTPGASLLAQNFTGSAGGWFYLLLANPAAVFYVIISKITGNTEVIAGIADLFGTAAPGFTAFRWFALGTGVQLLISCVLIVLAVRHVSMLHYKS